MTIKTPKKQNQMSAENLMIIIGIDEYQNHPWTNLSNAKSDAVLLHDILKAKYNFKSYELLLDKDADRRTINKVIRDINTLMADDNLLIFFAGHGQLENGSQGYWVPTDGTDDSSDFCSNADIISNVESCPARHVLVISDSCFSGSLLIQSRGGASFDDHDELESKDSRWIFVSGGLEKVSDGAKGEGSPFGRSLLQCLEKNQQPSMAAAQLFEDVIELTGRQSRQNVQYKEIQCSKNRGGQMIFRLSGSACNEQLRGIERELVKPVQGLTLPKHYIKRTVSIYKEKNNKKLNLFPDEAGVYLLKDLLVSSRKIVLLGSAGSGKSVELQNLALQLADSSSGFIPIYKRLNLYVDEPIDELLPSGWQKINEDRLVLILDALDEVQNQYFLTAVRRLKAFSEKYPGVRIVISCRTNFYDFPTENFQGTLADYSVQILNDVALADVKAFAVDHYKVDGDSFMRDVLENSYLDIVSKPFFLDLLIKNYQKNGSLARGRLDVMNGALDDAYVKSKQRFDTTIQYPKREHAFGLLEKVAFIMETMGKNFITEDDLAVVFPKKEEFDLLKYLPLFKKDENNGTWLFEHNNIQEYLASSILHRLPFPKLIEVISLKSGLGTKVKPTWSNTLSFYISTADEDTKNMLLDWIVEKDEEVMIRFEPERIPDDIRTEVFKKVFDHYNKLNIWLASNKFSAEDLARFGNFAEIADYLIEHLTQEGHSIIVNVNAIQVLSYFDLPKFPDQRDKVYTALMSLFKSRKLDVYGDYTLVRALSNLGFSDRKTIDQVLQVLGKSSNPHNRSAIYYLIGNSDYIDDYADVFWDGLDDDRRKELDNDRGDVNLLDEIWNLERGLQKIKSPKALKELFFVLSGTLEKKLSFNLDVNDVISDIIRNSINAYNIDTSVFDSVLDFHVAISPRQFKIKNKNTSLFFEETNTKKKAIVDVLKMENLPRFKKQDAIIPFIENEVVDYLIAYYTSGVIIKDEMELVFYAIRWAQESISDSELLMEKISFAVKKKDNVELTNVAPADWRKINTDKQQQSFNLIFNEAGILQEVENIYTEFGIDEFSKNNFFDLQRNDGTGIAHFAPRVIVDLVRELIFENGEVTYQYVAEWLKSDSFKYFQIETVYRSLNDDQVTIKVSDEQENIIRSWCLSKKGIETRVLWFFINKYEIKLDDERLLNLTLFYDHTKESSLELPGTIEQLEKFVSKEKIIERVSKNLLDKNVDQLLWVSNAGYALRNNLVEIYGSILKCLEIGNFQDYKIVEVLAYWFNKTGDKCRLQAFIKAANEDFLKWEAVSLLKDSGGSEDFLKDYFLDIISHEHSLLENKVKAANHLIELQDMNGFNYLADYVLHRKDPKIEFDYWMKRLKKLTRIEALDKLLELLALGKTQEFQSGSFSRLDQVVMEGIFAIGVHSAENFKKVEVGLLGFIAKYKAVFSDLDYIHINIMRMKEQISLKESKVHTLKTALEEYNFAIN